MRDQGRGAWLIGVDVTSNRARKHAARERAAATGEPYVVARRNLGPGYSGTGPDPAVETERPYPLLVRFVHDLTHRVPGVPKHTDPARIRAEHDARHNARAAEVRARHRARAARHRRPASDT